MDEKDLIKLWNGMRSQIITAQIAPALVLTALVALASFDKFDTASDATKFLAVGVAAITGILSMMSQYAAVREGQAVLVDLNNVKSKSELGKQIAESGDLLKISAGAIIGFGFAVFALVVWSILG
jgi:uncharacterized membrane protein